MHVCVCVLPRRRWGNDIKRDLKEVTWGGCGLDFVGSERKDVAACCEHGNELTARKFITMSTT